MASINFREREGDAKKSDEQLVMWNAVELLKFRFFGKYVEFITWMDAAVLPSDKHSSNLSLHLQVSAWGAALS